MKERKRAPASPRAPRDLAPRSLTPRRARAPRSLTPSQEARALKSLESQLRRLIPDPNPEAPQPRSPLAPRNPRATPEKRRRRRIRRRTPPRAPSEEPRPWLRLLPAVKMSAEEEERPEAKTRREKANEQSIFGPEY